MRDVHFYRAHLENDVLAWWLARGPDRELGGVRTCFANSGDTLVSTDKYTWSQGRWAWLLARLSQAGRRGLISVDAEDLLAQAVATGEFVATHALLGDGTTAYVTARDGTVRPYGPDGDPHASVFADLFAALGFAGLRRALAGTAADRWGELAEALLESAHEGITAGTARTEPYPVDPRFRGFAEPMMLMHVAAELHAATGSERSREIALTAARTALTGGFVDGTDVRDLAPRRPGLESTLLARHRTPGHLLEFAWFLTQACDQVPGLADVVPDPEWPARTALAALAIGWDRCGGGLLRHVDVEGGAPRGDLLGDPYEDVDGTTLGVLCHYACHPVTLGPDNHRVTADYPGYLVRELEARHPGATAMYVPGCAGQLNTGHSAADSVTGEPLVELALDIERRAAPPVVVVGYANGVPGYIPHRSAYAEGGYEPCEAHRFYGRPAAFAPEAAELLVEEALRAIEHLPPSPHEKGTACCESSG
jgi:N-acylglucosamine 2-epimerase